MGKKRPPASPPRNRRARADELAAEQGVKPIARLEEVLGKGADLWKNDAEFEAFLAGIYERRKNGR